jgi:hypothetical protein
MISAEDREKIIRWFDQNRTGIIGYDDELITPDKMLNEIFGPMQTITLEVQDIEFKSTSNFCEEKSNG